MSRPDYPETIFEFQRRFATDKAVLDYLIRSRWPDGFVCPRCGWQGEPYLIPTRKLFQCKQCHYQASVTAGTVMHRTKTPLPHWFWAAHFVATHTPGMSALQFARQTGMNYETAFMLLHKLRAATIRKERQWLYGTVEVDETYIGGPKKGPTGRGAKGKVIVAGAVEVRGTAAGRVRLKVIPNVTGTTLVNFVKNNIEQGSTIKTDGWGGYSGLRAEGYKHVVLVEGQAEMAPKLFPHIHRVFSNLKTWLLGTHHGVSPQHLQAYLNEYTFRFNRRRAPMAGFQTLLGLTKERLGPTYSGLPGILKKTGEWAHPNRPPKGRGF